MLLPDGFHELLPFFFFFLQLSFFVAVLEEQILLTLVVIVVEGFASVCASLPVLPVAALVGLRFVSSSLVLVARVPWFVSRLLSACLI